LTTKTYKYYHIFGLNLRSEIELPELQSIKATTDIVTINLDAVPNNLPIIQQEGILYQATNSDYLLKLKNIAKYRVTKKNEIYIEPLCSDFSLIRLFLYGPVLGACLIQNDFIPIHASSITHKNKAVLFSGQSAIGKSSIAASLYKRGFKFLSDDITSISCESNIIIAHSGPPHLKIWKDVINHLSIDHANKRVRKGIEKYSLGIDNSILRGTFSVNCLIVLKSINEHGFKLKEIRGVDKIQLLYENTYRKRYVIGLGVLDIYLQKLALLSKNINVFELYRPTKPLLINELADYIESKVLII